jgi:hypothetical protein
MVMAMSGTRVPWAAVAFMAGFLLVGMTYWVIPYSQVNLPDALYGPGLIAVALAAAPLRAGGVLPLWKAVGLAAAAVLARVVVEGLADPTSHNLWPLELMIASAVGLVFALPAGVVAAVYVRVTSRPGRRP